jgi:hypothetical protein
MTETEQEQTILWKNGLSPQVVRTSPEPSCRTRTEMIGHVQFDQDYLIMHMSCPLFEPEVPVSITEDDWDAKPPSFQNDY